MKVKYSQAVIVGIVAATLAAIQIYSVEAKSSFQILLYPMLYWFALGSVFHLIDFWSNKIVRAIPYTVFLNLPWYIEESVKRHNGGVFLILIVESIVMGVIVGFVSTKVQKKVAPNKIHNASL